MKSHGMVPFLDLVTPHLELEEELVAVFYSCIRNAHFIGGTMLEEFERDFAKFCEAKYCVGVANGTDAVRFALMGAGVPVEAHYIPRLGHGIDDSGIALGALSLQRGFS